MDACQASRVPALGDTGAHVDGGREALWVALIDCHLGEYKQTGAAKFERFGSPGTGVVYRGCTLPLDASRHPGSCIKTQG